MTDGANRIRVVLVADDDAADLVQVLQSSGFFQIAGVVPDWNNVEQLVRNYAPHIVLVSPHMRPPHHAAFPFLALAAPLDVPGLPARIQHKLEEFRSGNAATSVAATRQRILGGGNKGGVGKTTVLIEMATRYHQMGIKVLFVDISAACNIAVRLKLQDEVSYQPFPLEEVGQHIMMHGTGVSVLAIPHYFRLQPAQIDGLMAALQQTYPTLFIDGDHLRLYPYVPQADVTLIVGSASSLQDNMALLHDPTMRLTVPNLVLNQLSTDELAGLEEMTEVEGVPLFGLPYQEELPINMELGMTFTSRRASVSTPWFRYLDRLAQFLVTGVRQSVPLPGSEASAAEVAAFAPASLPEQPAINFQAPAITLPVPAFNLGTPAAEPEPAAAPAFTFQPTPTAEPAASPAPSFNFRSGPAEAAPAPAEAAPAFSFQPTPTAEPAAPSFNFHTPAAPAELPLPEAATGGFAFKPMSPPQEVSPAEAAPSFNFRRSEPPVEAAKEEVVDAESEAPVQVFDLDKAEAASTLEEAMQDKGMKAYVARAEQQPEEPKEPEPTAFDLGEEFFPAEAAREPEPPPEPLPPPKPRIQLAEAPLQIVMARLAPALALTAGDLLPPRIEAEAQDEPQTVVELLDALVDTVPRANHVGEPVGAAASGTGNGGPRRVGPAPSLPQRPVLASLELERPRHFNTFKVKIRSKDAK